MDIMYGRRHAYPQAGSCCNAQVLPSGSLKVTNEPHGCPSISLACREEPGQRGSELAGLGDPQDGRAGLVRGREVDQGADAPVVVPGRIVEDLAHRPVAGVLVDDQQPGTTRVGACADLVMLIEIRLDSIGPGLGVPAGRGVQLAQLVVMAPGGKLNAAEQRV